MPCSTALSPDEIALVAAAELDFEPERPPHGAKLDAGWSPDLSLTQRAVFDCPVEFQLVYGEKGSGKTVGVLHKMVRHCYEEWDSLAIIITPSIRTGRYGAMADLETLVLPAWTEGIGLDWLPSKLDPSTKDRILKIGNRHGGWSTVMQISIPYAEAIAPRIKGISPSFVMADELTDCDGREYFTVVTAQMNRRRHISGPQCYLGTCNPKGPSHWVYQQFFVEGENDPKFKIWHIPFTENAHRPEMRNYLDNLERSVRHDPIERQRLIEGVWVERPTGEAIFRSYFVADRHVVGSRADGTGLVPVKGLPCCVGMDLGQVNSSVTFLQQVETSDGLVWMVFDEIAVIKQRHLYAQLAADIVERILEWNTATGSKLAWEIIADDSAVNQWRPGGSGSLDSFVFDEFFEKASQKHGIKPMRVRGCPKGAGSVLTRVRLVQGLLATDSLLVSAQCPFTQQMLLQLEGEKNDPLKPKRTVSGEIHCLDSLSYPILYHEVRGPTEFRGAPVSSIIKVGG